MTPALSAQVASLPLSHPDSEAWHRAFRPVATPHGPVALEVEGRLPQGLLGTLYRNGPGTFEVGGEPFGHWFDGDGFVQAVSLDGEGGARGACRFVESPERSAEQEHGKAHEQQDGGRDLHGLSMRAPTDIVVRVGCRRWTVEPAGPVRGRCAGAGARARPPR